MLDNDTELDINISVTHTIPAPGSGGTTRYLDASVASNGSGTEGSPYKLWTTAIGALATNDVLVVRARIGGDGVPGQLTDERCDQYC